jgi:hypothetical protein
MGDNKLFNRRTASRLFPCFVAIREPSHPIGNYLQFRARGTGTALKLSLKFINPTLKSQESQPPKQS